MTLISMAGGKKFPCTTHIYSVLCMSIHHTCWGLKSLLLGSHLQSIKIVIKLTLPLKSFLKFYFIRNVFSDPYKIICYINTIM